MGLGALIGISVGLASGYLGGWFDLLVQRLLDAMTALGRLQGQAAELGGKDLALDETVAALRSEAEAQQAAAREIAALLGSPGA